MPASHASLAQRWGGGGGGRGTDGHGDRRRAPNPECQGKGRASVGDAGRQVCVCVCHQVAEGRKEEKKREQQRTKGPGGDLILPLGAVGQAKSSSAIQVMHQQNLLKSHNKGGEERIQKSAGELSIILQGFGARHWRQDKGGGSPGQGGSHGFGTGFHKGHLAIQNHNSWPVEIGCTLIQHPSLK